MDGYVLHSSKCILVCFNIVASETVVMPGRQAHTCVDRLPSLVILGMLFLAATNPTMDWCAKFETFDE